MRCKMAKNSNQTVMVGRDFTEREKNAMELIYNLANYVVQAAEAGNFELGQSVVKDGNLYLKLPSGYIKISLGKNRKFTNVDDLNDTNENTNGNFHRIIYLLTRTLLGWADEINESSIPLD